MRIGTFDQRGLDLPLDERVREAVAGPTRAPDRTDAALLERFWFGNDAQWAPIRLLSGGERRRLQLVLLLRQAPNVLLLDEPTNDLDLDTLRALEDMLETWPGALVVVSHDRAFLERTVTDVILLDGKGHAGRVPGGYAAYEAERRAARSGPRGRTASTAGAVAPAGARSAPARRPGGAVGSATAPGAARSASTLRHLMKRAESDMKALERRQAALEAELAEAGTDHAALARIGAAMGTVAADLAAAEDAWLALAEEAEARP